jgi:tetratricopeptide (TPR) repeat protein
MLKSVTVFLSTVMLLIAVLFVSTTNAQTTTAQTVVRTPLSPEDAAAARRDYDAAFRAVLANPRDLDLMFRYAEITTAVGDLEGAIGAYESLLLINPNLPHVQLALGELYLKLESMEAARGYLEAARDGANATADTRQSISSPAGWSGSVTLRADLSNSVVVFFVIDEMPSLSAAMSSAVRRTAPDSHSCWI